MRRQRRALSHEAQHRAAQALARRVARLAMFRRARSVALYLANDGEISPSALMRLAFRRGKSVYLPCLKADKSLCFRHVSPRTQLQPNRFGIPEPPRMAQAIDAAALDIVLVPLVAFDRAGRRMGMGGGYYDRTFAFKRQLPTHGPILIGLAHSCQETQRLVSQPWDVPLDWIVTDLSVIRGELRRR